VEHEPFTEWAALYAMGTLEGEERTQFEAHLATGCSDCTTMLSELSAVVATLAWAAPAVSPRPELREKLLARVRTESSPEALSFSLTRSPAWVW
jgi:anti-sigma-K factor RskA